MKIKSLFVVASLFFCFTLCSQNLLHDRQTGYYTYIYQLNDKEAKKINKKEILMIDTTCFHTLVDTYPTDSVYSKKLSPGHYVKTHLSQNKQITEYTCIPELEIFILNNNTDLCLQVYDLNGNPISDAIVKIKSKKLNFDKKTQSYVDKKSNKKGLLSVTYKGNTSYYHLDRSYNNSALLRGSKTVLSQTPLKYVWIPVAFIADIPADTYRSIKKGWPQGTIYLTRNYFTHLGEKINCLIDNDECDYSGFLDKYTGYLVYNKPQYLPGDTVKFKAFVTNRKGKPVNDSVAILLYDAGMGKTITLARLYPYSKGAYEYQFFLHDSLNLKLDRRYILALGKINKPWLRYIDEQFRYEDYELSKINLNIRSVNKEHYRNTPLTLFATATDENNLNLPDAYVKVLGKPLKTNLYFDDLTFIPDTLLYFDKSIDPNGETKIEIADSLFPKANFDYELSFTLLTSDNKRFVTKEKFTYLYLRENYDIALIDDSLEFIYSENGIRKPRQINISALDNFNNKNDILSSVTPCKIPLNPYFSTYIAEGEKTSNAIDLSSQTSLLQ
jgi:hypothetical protein